MLLSNRAAESTDFRGFESGNDQFSSPEPPFPAGIKAWCDTFLSVSLVQLNPGAMSLYLTRKRQTSPAVERCLRDNARMTEVFRLHSQWERRRRKQFDLWVCRPLRWAHRLKNWDCHLHADLLWVHNDSAFLFSYCDVHSTPVQWYRGALLLSFLTMGSCRGRWGRSPGGLAAESNSFALYFWLCAERRPRPVSGAYMSMVAGGGRATVRCCISLVPPSFTLCVRFHWSCQGFTPFSCPLVCVYVCVWGREEGGKGWGGWSQKQRKRERQIHSVEEM